MRVLKVEVDEEVAKVYDHFSEVFRVSKAAIIGGILEAFANNKEALALILRIADPTKYKGSIPRTFIRKAVEMLITAGLEALQQA